MTASFDTRTGSASVEGRSCAAFALGYMSLDERKLKIMPNMVKISMSLNSFLFCVE